MDDRMLASVRPRLVLVKAVGTARPAQSQSGGYFDARAAHPQSLAHAGAHHGWCRNLLRGTAGAATKSMAVSASVDRVRLAGPSAAAPHACQDKPAMRRGGAYRCWKSATTLERDSTAGDYAHGGRIGERRATKTNARVGLRWCHLLRKSACFSMCAGSAYWCHLAAKSFAISTNGSIRSESTSNTKPRDAPHAPGPLLRARQAPTKMQISLRR